MIYVESHAIKSLGVLEVAINSQSLGIVSKVNYSTLSSANRKRSAACSFGILEQLLAPVPRKIRHDMKQIVRVLDGSPIQLKGCSYDEWAKSYATHRCQGLKLHEEYDLALTVLMHVALI